MQNENSSNEVKAARIARRNARAAAEAKWHFKSTIRNSGSDRHWVEQRHEVTGERRFVSQTRSGKSVVRYGSTPRN